jgi:hypothetical protein
MAQAILDAICARVARGTDPQTVVDEFAPIASERNGVAHWTLGYLPEAVRSLRARDVSPTYLHELYSERLRRAEERT